MDTANEEVQDPIFLQKIWFALLAAAYKLIFFQLLLRIYNFRTIVIMSFLFQEYLHVFMYVMCFNVSIHFKMGSLYSYCDIITKLVYPPELSRIAGFCTYSNKNFLGDPLSSRIVWDCIITIIQQIILKKLKTHTQSPPPIFLANSRWNCLNMSYLKSLLFIIFSWMDVWKNKEKSLKTPWKCTSKLPEKGMSWSVRTMQQDCWFGTHPSR